jgi:O-antigen ligase
MTLVRASGSDRLQQRLDMLIFCLLGVFLLSTAFSIALSEIGYFSALCLWLIKMAWQRRKLFEATPLDYFFLAYAIAEALATLFADHKLYSLNYLQRRLLLLPITYVLLANIKSEKQLRILFLALIVSSVATALWGMQDLILHLNEYIHFQKRIAEFQMYMTAGGIMMIAVLLLIPFVVHPATPKKIRIWILVALIPLGINLLFTFTRSSWLGFIAGAVVIGAIRTRKVFFVLAVGVALLIALSSTQMRSRIFSIVDPNHRNNVARVNMWRTGLRIVHDYPVFGIGDVGVETVWYRYSDPGWTEEGHLHSNLIMWLATTGIVGCGVLLALFVKMWLVVARIEKRFRHHWFTASLALGGLAVQAGFHVNGLFEWNFGDAEIITLVWAVLGLILAAEKVTPVVEGGA